MTLNYEEEGEVKLPVDCEGLAKEVIEAALDYAECPYEAEVNLLLTTDEEIHQMNKEHRGIDIVISKDRVIAQAEEYGHEIKREYAFLIAHSMLHLFGYDHMEEEERKTMERMQNEILNALNIVR